MALALLAVPRCRGCRSRVWFADDSWTDANGQAACPVGDGHEPDPLTDADRAALEAADHRPLLVERPKCPSGHGYLTLRNPPGGWTAEQEFCGIWYDCSGSGPARCGTTVLVPSVAYLTWLSGQRRRP
jgi:hypothetical protein